MLQANSQNNQKDENRGKNGRLFSFFQKMTKGKSVAKNSIDYPNNDWDKKLVYSLSKSKIPNLRQFKYINRFLNKNESFALYISLAVFILCMIFMGYRFYISHLTIVPAQGDRYIEALIGAPKYINPIYASSNDVDSDISSLVFSSLFKRGRDGQLMNDLAIDYAMGSDNKSYIIRVRTDAKWHNGNPITVDDIVFTFGAIKDSAYHSPLRTSFSGVDLEKIDDQNIKFTLSQPYAPFKELLTFGILPAGLWSEVAPESANLASLNQKPVGSGPYQFKSFVKDQSGNLKSITLVSNKNYYGKIPYVNEVVFKFYVNFEEAISALNKDEVQGMSYLPQQFKGDIVSHDSLNFHVLSMPQITAIFFNAKNNPALDDKRVREALAHALDKNAILKDVGGDETIADGPISRNSFAYNQKNVKYDFNAEEAAKLLDGAGWKISALTAEQIKEAEKNKDSKDEKVKAGAETLLALGQGNWRKKTEGKAEKYLLINLTTIDSQENTAMADSIKKSWEALGVRTNTEIITASQIQSTVIRPRNFEALYYGQALGADPDVYAFWHSSQAGDNGLNISDYSNKEVDQLLEDARISSSTADRLNKYLKFQEIVTSEIPAIFMFSPDYIYVQAKRVKGFDTANIIVPKDRFSDVADWYINTKNRLKW
jgi:peptide/nickel transport system substrate-binding protein